MPSHALLTSHLSPSSSPSRSASARSMSDAIEYRGPENFGEWADEQVGIGLAIDVWRFLISLPRGISR
jgi:asparagine synthetase B (glutamine-hydrolysing)